MSEISNVFLISSPLQVFVADSILAKFDFEQLRATMIVVEDEAFCDAFPGLECISICSTRLEGQKTIAHNLRAPLSNLTGAVSLWVSDILWPMNNAIYTELLRSDMLHRVNFFDEGIVLYWQERLSLYSRLRERAKFIILSERLKVQFTAPAGRPFYDNRLNGEVYALHPKLLTPNEKVRPLEIDLGRVAGLTATLEDRTGAVADAELNLQAGSALVLSQPHYRIADGGKFKSLVGGLAQQLRQRGHDRLYVKLHPSEGIDLFDQFYRDYGFEVAFAGMKSPIEAILQNLPASCTLASYNSSALLNARKFGFKGQVLSYGSNWVAAQYPMQRRLGQITQSLFERAEIEVVLT